MNQSQYNEDNISSQTGNIRPGRRSRKKKSKGKLLPILTTLLVLFVGFFAFKVWDIWSSVERTVNKIQIPRAENQVQLRTEPVKVVENDDPITVLLMGIDTGEYGRVEKGRSDVMVLATVNPNKKEVSLTSLPRDSYVSIPGQADMTKLNHAYAYGGPGLAANTVQDLLDIPVDYTISADMKGFKEIIDAVGGITVTPPTTFSQGGFDFVEGQPVTMNGTMALEYIRNRYDSGGDYGRQDRARQVILGILKAGANLDSLFNYQPILDSVSNNVKMDISYDELMHIVTNYQSALDHVVEHQLQGTSQTIDGVSYEVLDDASLNQVKEALKAELDFNN